MDYNNIIEKYKLIKKGKFIYKEYMYIKYHIATIQDDGLFFIPSFKYIKLIYKIVNDLNGKNCYIMLPGKYDIDLVDDNRSYALLGDTLIKWSGTINSMDIGERKVDYYNQPPLYGYNYYNSFTKIDYEYKLEDEYNIISSSLFYYINRFGLKDDDFDNFSKALAYRYRYNSLSRNSGENNLKKLMKRKIYSDNMKILKELDIF